ncbi:hypothetical protein [uncultured Thiodictyon sp.]|jgi:hypothetical protein|uniref:hypothetical protein n=1 Tax=uncultured Thiodictyon sp. TaxID=1846217 RepID=UPI0025FCC799|nr:hypothetical protein [uncultured Thiodictyon sp.]
MKSQDIVVLLKLLSLELAGQRRKNRPQGSVAEPFDWAGWELSAQDEAELNPALPGYNTQLSQIVKNAERRLGLETNPHEANEANERYSVRGLSASLGISKTEVAASLRRSVDVGLARKERQSGLLRTNARALLDLLEHAVKYVFPARPGALGRGIPTAFAAPVLADGLRSAGDSIFVWPYARGSRMGQSITPLFMSVPVAVQSDPDLYAMLALVDAIRLGNPRERSLAVARLTQRFGVQ